MSETDSLLTTHQNIDIPRRRSRLFREEASIEVSIDEFSIKGSKFQSSYYEPKNVIKEQMKPINPGQPKKMNMPSLQQFVDQQMEVTGEDEFQRRRKPKGNDTMEKFKT